MKPQFYYAGVISITLLVGAYFPKANASLNNCSQDTFTPKTVLELSGQPKHVIDFINWLQPLAVEEMNKYHIPASVILAQAILESGYGLSPLAQHAGNYFGIKANRWKLETYPHNGAVYRSYRNLYDCFDDHSKFLLEKPVFQNLVQRRDCSYTSWLYGLDATGYAEDPEYIFKLRGIIERYALYRLDELIPQSSVVVVR